MSAKKEATVSIRLSQELKEQLLDLMTKSGSKSISDYGNTVLHNHARRQGKSCISNGLATIPRLFIQGFNISNYADPQERSTKTALLELLAMTFVALILGPAAIAGWEEES